MQGQTSQKQYFKEIIKTTVNFNGVYGSAIATAPLISDSIFTSTADSVFREKGNKDTHSIGDIFTWYDTDVNSIKVVFFDNPVTIALEDLKPYDLTRIDLSRSTIIGDWGDFQYFPNLKILNTLLTNISGSGGTEELAQGLNSELISLNLIRTNISGDLTPFLKFKNIKTLYLAGVPFTTQQKDDLLEGYAAGGSDYTNTGKVLDIRLNDPPSQRGIDAIATMNNFGWTVIY